MRLLEKHLPQNTQVDFMSYEGKIIPRYTNEFWTSKQRQAARLHEIAYRACFKPQLPRFFIKIFSRRGSRIYDPFSGRGTTAVESALLKRNPIANDLNPLAEIITRPRLSPPRLEKIEKRLENIPMLENAKANRDLTMFYHPQTLSQIVSLKNYLLNRQNQGQFDLIDAWIRMVATNRLSGHSKGFFSVYTLPPNQAVSPERQIKLNQKRDLVPPFRSVKNLVLKKSATLLKGIDDNLRTNLHRISKKAEFLCHDARATPEINSNSVQLTVTSPPFLDVVQYAQDNWLRCWFNHIDASKVALGIKRIRSLENWNKVMGQVFREIFRITRPNGFLAFEVGEVKQGRIKLEEQVIPLGIQAGFQCQAILVNQQTFTKTANIWGVNNNQKGTNSNRIVIFSKP